MLYQELIRNPIVLLLVGVFIGLYLSRSHWFRAVRVRVSSRQFQDSVLALLAVSGIIIQMAVAGACMAMIIILPILHLTVGLDWVSRSIAFGVPMGIIVGLATNYMRAAWHEILTNLDERARGEPHAER